jgi:hypothetical protein
MEYTMLIRNKSFDKFFRQHYFRITVFYWNSLRFVSMFSVTAVSVAFDWQLKVVTFWLSFGPSWFICLVDVLFGFVLKKRDFLLCDQTLNSSFEVVAVFYR